MLVYNHSEGWSRIRAVRQNKRERQQSDCGMKRWGLWEVVWIRQGWLLSWQVGELSVMVNDYNPSTQGRGGPETGGSLDSQGCSLEKLRAGFAALQESTKLKALLSPAPQNSRERRQMHTSVPCFLMYSASRKAMASGGPSESSKNNASLLIYNLLSKRKETH